ncbi:GBF-interacting protein 1-like isoform X3 [Tripterygium wilfordii]|uniref:GBF-interacting protein 1-like isoform X3 n=1 Tax=Tripterygium wilfordii TaxID=458696 RepID=UPI0018F7F90B|nr:GBF-interacting protein 1-like isoform X3 [Tripterygium wilfordii]
MSGGRVGGGRVAIPESTRKTIKSIREITGKNHSDDEIYAVLEECSMDPNEAIQKLFYLDPFHVVKSKRDRRKENLNRTPENSRSTQRLQERGMRVGRGNYSSNYISNGFGGGKNESSRKENGVNHVSERGSQKMHNNGASHMTDSSTVLSNGSSLLNGSSSPPSVPQLSAGPVIDVGKESSAADENNSGKTPLPLVVNVEIPLSASISSSDLLLTSTSPASASGGYSSASDPVLEPSLSGNTGTLSKIKHEVGSRQKVAEQNHIQGSKLATSDVGSELPKNSHKTTSPTDNYRHMEKEPGKTIAVEKNQWPESSHFTSSAALEHSMAPRTSGCDGQLLDLKVVSSEVTPAKGDSKLSPGPGVLDGRHVTFPSHFKVPEALISGLTFGSLDTELGLGTKDIDGANSDINCSLTTNSSQGSDETVSPSKQNTSSNARADKFDSPHTYHDGLDKIPSGEGNVTSNADSKDDQTKEEMPSLPEGHQNPTFLFTPNYSFGIMPPMPGSQLVRFENPDTQARDVTQLPNFVAENPLVSSSASQTPPLQNSIATALQPLPFFRQPYPPNYFPYGPYFSPFLMPPMHQFLGHNGFPQQPSTGNVYLPPAAAAPGVKLPLPQLKPGTGSGNPSPIGFPSIYGAYPTSPIGFNPAPAVTSESSAANEDLSTSQMRENHVFSSQQLGEEGSGVWIHAPSQDISSLQVNPLYSLPQNGQIAFSPAQASHSTFAGIYQPSLTMTAPSTVNPLLQPSQAVAATVEPVGPAPGAYQQPSQLAHVNWNPSYTE